MPTVQELNKKMRSISELLDIVEAISYFIENSDLNGKFGCSCVVHQQMEQAFEVLLDIGRAAIDEGYM